jgi:hypothetical protein
MREGAFKIELVSPHRADVYLSPELISSQHNESFVREHLDSHSAKLTLETGEKAKEKRETEERDAENQQRAGLAYITPRSGDIVADSNLSGLPWGGVSMRHIIERGQTREAESQQGSQELSYFNYRTGGGSGKGSDSR